MYQWLVALHIIAVIAWMAGMLYLPRLFVYHCEADVGSIQSETFKVMEWRLLKVIINPAMIAAWVLGLWLAWQGGWFAAHRLEVEAKGFGDCKRTIDFDIGMTNFIVNGPRVPADFINE